MAEVLIHIKLPEYLAEWFIHENGNSQPIHLRRNSPEAAIIEDGLRVKPIKGKPLVPPEGANVVIVAPQFQSNDPRRHPYLVNTHRTKLRQCIRNKFLISLWYEMHQRRKLALPIFQNVRDFMTSHGITYTDEKWETIRQTYYRMRDVNPNGKKKFASVRL